MRRLLNTLYVTSPDAYLSLDGENIVVLKEGKEAIRVPFLNIEGVVAFGYTGASPAFMGACAKRGVALSFLTASGRFLARVTGGQQGNVRLRKEQYRISDDPRRSAELAKYMLMGKLYNARWVLERATRDHALRLDSDNMKTVALSLKQAGNTLLDCDTLEEIRGVEGAAAARYFGVFDDLILQQKDAFAFSTRSRRPPLDNVNALLSFVYMLLTYEMAAALESVGLDPYVGFLHRDRPGRQSLALDMIEALRPVMADRFVLTLINMRAVKASGFLAQPSGGVTMDDATRKTVLSAWQERKKETITHPYLEEKIPWGLVPYAQSLLLARYIRGDLDAYPVFLWK